MNITSSPTTSKILGALTMMAIFVAGILVGTAFSGAQSEAIVEEETARPSGVDLTSFWTAWNALDERFVASTEDDLPSRDERMWGAIQGLAASYGDPYTTFFPPEESKIFEEDISGQFGGVGMEIAIRDDTLMVVSPLKGTPADEADILPGDMILAINNDSTQDMSVDEAVQRIRGEKGTTVNLLLLREGDNEPVEVTLTRDTISIPTIEHELRDDGVYVISLYNFSAQSPELFRDALEAFDESASTNLVIDVRGNPGGFLEAAVDISSYFLPAGKVVVIEDFGENKKQPRRSRGVEFFTELPEIVVLMNGGSASASEILAGALKEHDVATIVGTTSFGKGSVQELVRIPEDSSLKITVARWLTPNGVSFSDGGLDPDIEVPMTLEDVEAGEDPQLDRAVQILTQ